jgi:hypothetical protein
VLRELHTLKDCNKTLIPVSALVLLTLLVFSDGLGAAPDQPDKVVINILGSTVQSGSNIVTFLITNAFEFPIRYAAVAQTKEGMQTWKPVYSSGRSIALRRGQIAARDTTTFTWELPPTNRWKIEVSYNDPRPTIFRRRVQGYVSSPEMTGGSSIAPVK